MTVKVELIDGDATFGLRIELAGGNAIDLLIDKGQETIPRASLWSGNVEFPFEEMEADEFRDWVTVAMGGQPPQEKKQET